MDVSNSEYSGDELNSSMPLDTEGNFSEIDQNEFCPAPSNDDDNNAWYCKDCRLA
jgi:hypothetical protein